MGNPLMRGAAAAGLLLTTIAPALTAQATIRGILYNDATGAPVHGTVLLVDPSTDAPVVRASADSLGHFSLRVGRGDYQVAAICAGFTSVLSAPIALLSGEQLTLRIPIAEGRDPEHQIGVLEHIRPDAQSQRMSSAQMRAAAATPGFETRRQVGNGLQYDRAGLERSPAHTLGEFLSGVPGFRVPNPNSTSSMQLSRNSAMAAAAGAAGASSCRLGWFVDGHRMDIPGRTDPMTDGISSWTLDSIEALEIFRGLSEMPAEFAAPDLRCGAIAVWTRRG